MSTDYHDKSDEDRSRDVAIKIAAMCEGLDGPSVLSALANIAAWCMVSGNPDARTIEMRCQVFFEAVFDTAESLVEDARQ